MNPLRKYYYLMLFVLALCQAIPPAAATETYQLRDYIQAVRVNDVHRTEVLQAYMLGAAETHFLYSRMLRNWTGINILCPGEGGLDQHELAGLVELKIHALRRRYGADIMGLPLATAVQMIMEEQFKC